MSKYTDDYKATARAEAKQQYENAIKNIDDGIIRYGRTYSKFQDVCNRLRLLEDEYLAAKSRFEKYAVLFEAEKKSFDNARETYNNLEAAKITAKEQYENRLRRLEEK